MSGGGGGTQTIKETLDPTVRPFVQYGLRESQRLYESDTPQYYPNRTYTPMGVDTQMALNAARNRATAGSNLTRGGQETVGRLQTQMNPYSAMRMPTASGAYVGGNPFLQSAIDAATRGSQQKFFDDTARIQSAASRAGRYGSAAQQDMQDRALGAYSQALADTSAKIGYQDYATERARQEQAQQNLMAAAASDLGRQLSASQLSPAMADADYSDLDRLLQVGQVGEDYQQQALADSIARWNYAQQRPYTKLQSFLSGAYGAPAGMERVQPIYRNRLASALGGGSLGLALAGEAGSKPLYGGLGALAGGLLG